MPSSCMMAVTVAPCKFTPIMADLPPQPDRRAFTWRADA